MYCLNCINIRSSVWSRALANPDIIGWAFYAEWTDQALDDNARQGLDDLREGMCKLARDREQHLDFLFMNDAESSQNVLGSYGKKSLEALRETAAKYDPNEFFQKYQRAGFLLRSI